MPRITLYVIYNIAISGLFLSLKHTHDSQIFPNRGRYSIRQNACVVYRYQLWSNVIDIFLSNCPALSDVGDVGDHGLPLPGRSLSSNSRWCAKCALFGPLSFHSLICTMNTAKHCHKTLVTKVVEINGTKFVEKNWCSLTNYANDATYRWLEEECRRHFVLGIHWDEMRRHRTVWLSACCLV